MRQSSGQSGVSLRYLLTALSSPTVLVPNKVGPLGCLEFTLYLPVDHSSATALRLLPSTTNLVTGLNAIPQKNRHRRRVSNLGTSVT